MFSPYKSDTGAVPAWEYIPGAAGTYKAGQMLTVSGGRLTAVAAATKTTPLYLCMGDVTIADGENLPVTRVTDDMIYVTELSAEAAAAAVGSKLEISDDGMTVDAAAEGTFELVALDGTDAGSLVYGRFV